MSLTSLYNILNGIDGFSDKVAYYCFPVGKAPALPFICYLIVNSENFVADSQVYQTINTVHVELYTEQKDESTEQLLESALNSNGIPWDKEEEFLDDEQCFMITYTITI